ncbi:jg18390, partial [Pararge aegeria aegeria]
MTSTPAKLSTRKGPACEESIGVLDIASAPTYTGGPKAQAKQKAEDDLLKEAAVVRFQRKARKEVTSSFGQRVDEKTADRLQDQVWEDLDLIRK